MGRAKKFFPGMSSILGGSLLAAFILLILFLLSQGIFGELDPMYRHNLTLRINPKSQLDTVRQDMDAGFVAANQGTALVALVQRAGTLGYLSTGSGTIAMNQKIPSNKFYLVFSEGSAIEVLRERIAMIKSGEFDKYSRPAFGFALSSERHVVISRTYKNIDLESGGIIRLYPGMYNVAVKSDRAEDGGPRILVAVE